MDRWRLAEALEADGLPVELLKSLESRRLAAADGYRMRREARDKGKARATVSMECVGMHPGVGPIPFEGYGVPRFFDCVAPAGLARRDRNRV